MIDRPDRPGPAPKRRVWLGVLIWALASAVAAIGLLAAQPAIGLSMDVLSLVMLAPAIGAGVARLAVRRHMPVYPKRAPAGPFLLALGLALLTALIYFGAVSAIRGHLPQIPLEVAGVSIDGIIMAQALGALCEEIGFRGVLLHALAGRMPRIVAAIAVGVLFGLWHPQYFALPPAQHAMFMAGTVALTVTTAYVMTGGFWQRMAVCTVIHLGANLALAWTGRDVVSMTVFGAALVLGCAVVAPIGWLVGRRGGGGNDGRGRGERGGRGEGVDVGAAVAA